MVALWKSIKTNPDAMIKLAGLPIGRHSYEFAEVIRAGEAVGLQLKYVYPATWDVVRQELDQKRPVVTLLRYGLISHNQDDFDGSHFWTVIGYDDQFVYVNDPDYWGVRRLEGKARAIPIQEFIDATGDALLATGNKPRQALFVKVS